MLVLHGSSAGGFGVVAGDFLFWRWGLAESGSAVDWGWPADFSGVRFRYGY